MMFMHVRAELQPPCIFAFEEKSSVFCHYSINQVQQAHYQILETETGIQ